VTDSTQFILDTCKALQKDQFEFSIEVNGTIYDVYWFVARGKRGQVAFALVDGKAVIAYFRAGSYSAKEIEDYMREYKQ